MSEAELTTPPVDLAVTSQTFSLSLADRIVVLSKTGDLLKNAFTVETHGDGERQLLLTGLNPGVWTMRSQNGQIRHEAQVAENKNTAFFLLPKGQYAIEPKP